jgi:tRNA (guanine37-N1)-methyltransferase
MTEMTQTKEGTTDGSKSNKKEDAVIGSSSVFDSFSKVNLEEIPSLLSAIPDTGGAGGENGDDNETSGNAYVYPADSFPSLSAFEVSTEFPALILPVRRTHELRKKLKSIMLSRPRLSVVVEVSDCDLDDNTKEEKSSSGSKTLKLSGENRKQYRKLVLDPQKAGLNHKTGDSTNDAKATTTMNSDLKDLLENEAESFRLGSHTIVLTYQDWTAEEILGRLLLPEGVKEVPSAFEAVGHLAHVNLRDELLPYKYLVGKVLLDKNTPRIRTVVNKLGSIDNKYRTFGMEVIAGSDGSNGKDGESWSEVLVREEGCEYRLDFRKVYWNSRLGGEHRRLVKVIRKDASARAQLYRDDQETDGESIDTDSRETPKTSLVVADLMAGIGPFAIPLTARTKGSKASKTVDPGKSKKKNNDQATNRIPPLPIEVYANDLNPSSYEYLVVNAKRNRCDFVTNDDTMDSGGNDHKHKLYAYNMDARAFCHRLQDRGIFPDHCIMNLPATALEFLDAFRGYPRVITTADDNSGNKGDDLPRIHVHCFAPKDTQAAKKEIWERAENSLGCPLDEEKDKVVIHPVRDIAPNKNMYCISFRLPAAASALPRIQLEEVNMEVEEPDSKRRKIDE